MFKLEPVGQEPSLQRRQHKVHEVPKTPKPVAAERRPEWLRPPTEGPGTRWGPARVRI